MTLGVIDNPCSAFEISGTWNDGGHVVSPQLTGFGGVLEVRTNPKRAYPSSHKGISVVGTRQMIWYEKGWPSVPARDSLRPTISQPSQ